MTAKSLGSLSRSIVNRNVKIENIDSLPIPTSLKDDCFVNVGLDRYDEEFIERISSDPCQRGCGNFPMSKDFQFSRLVHQIPSWSKSAKARFNLQLFYSANLPEFSTDAEWIQLPDRETMLKSYRASNGMKRQILEACLNPLRFHSSTGLGNVHDWIRRYLFYQDEHGWYHLSIKAGWFKDFLRIMKNVPMVLLPYGCISENGADGKTEPEYDCLTKHQRRMIIVVKNNDDAYRQALAKLKLETEYTKNYHSIKICDVKHFINTIGYVSRPKFKGSVFTYPDPDRHYIIFQPMIWHAIWWMLLLVPKGCLNDFAQFRILSKTHDLKRKNCVSLELGIENCVVQFEPLYQCIGDDVRNLINHVEENKPFIYWLGGRVLNVTEIKNVPSFVTQSDDPKTTFIEWCVLRGMNTLLNLNGDSWVSNKQTKWNESSEDETTQNEKNLLDDENLSDVESITTEDENNLLASEDEHL